MPDQFSLGTAGVGSRGWTSAMYFSGYCAHSASKMRLAISRRSLSAPCGRSAGFVTDAPIQYRCLILEHTTRPRNSLPVAAFSPRFRSAVFSQSRTWRGASEPILVTHNPKGRRRATRSALDLALATNLNCSATRPVHYSDGDAVPHLSAQTEPPLLDLTQPSTGLFFA
jgi:hypothetical protein